MPPKRKGSNEDKKEVVPITTNNIQQGFPDIVLWEELTSPIVELPELRYNFKLQICCSNCNNKVPILGNRYKCNTRENYNLCIKCYKEESDDSSYTYKCIKKVDFTDEKKQLAEFNKNFNEKVLSRFLNKIVDKLPPMTITSDYLENMNDMISPKSIELIDSMLEQYFDMIIETIKNAVG